MDRSGERFVPQQTDPFDEIAVEHQQRYHAVKELVQGKDVLDAGSGDGYASLHNAVTGEFIMGINGGRLPEFSRMANPKYGCDCTPKSHCRTGIHGTNLLRGWRNVLYELVSRRRVLPTPEIAKILGGVECRDAYDYAHWKSPTHDLAPAWEYSSL